tara:strand:+ start:275 stop:994 length:720 start_codon:yes stop_codon:yes gene_type:complete
MCNPAAAVAGGQMAVGLVGSYMAYKAAEKQAEENNRLKDESDARLKDKLVFNMGQASQKVADLDKQEQQVEDIEQNSLMQAELDYIRAQGQMNVAELQEGQSTDLVEGQMVRESLNVKDTIKDNAGIDKLNINYQHRDVGTSVSVMKMDTINAIASTQYQSPPMKEMFMLQGLTSVANSAQTYYSMPDSAKKNWDFSWDSSNKSTKKSSVGKGLGSKRGYFSSMEGGFTKQYGDMKGIY